MVLLYLPEEGTGFKPTGSRCVEGSMMCLCTLLKSKAKLYAYLCLSGLRFRGKLWIRKAVTSNLWSPCSWVLLSVLSSECVFSPTLHLSSCGGAVWWGNSYSLLVLPPPGGRTCFRAGVPLRNLRLQGSRLSPDPSGSHWASHGKSTCRKEVEFWPGRRYFPAFDVWLTHLRQPLRGGERLSRVIFAFPVPVWDGARCHSGCRCLSDTAQAVSLLGQAKLSMSCKSRELNSHTQFSFFR